MNERKLKVYTIFIKKSFLAVPKDFKLNCSHFFYCENCKQTKTLKNLN